MENNEPIAIETSSNPINVYDYFNLQTFDNLEPEFATMLGNVRESIVREPSREVQAYMVIAHIRKYSWEDRTGKAREIHIKLKKVLDGLIG